MNSISLPSKMTSLPVAVDAMGGDFGSSVVVEGAVVAARELEIASVLVGNEEELKKHLEKLGASSDPRITIQHASEVVSMDDSPSLAIRGKTDSSIRVAFELVKSKKASSVVSPGNTGAMMAAGLFVAGTVPGIARPAIATLIPRISGAIPTVLLDSGANTDCHAYQLIQFALMGNYYAMSALRCEKPRVALLSNGSELSKGNEVTRLAAQTLSEYKGINFTGYIEGRDIGRDMVDVVVCDGFVGNIVLKCMEGSAELVMTSIKQHVQKNFRGKIGMWLAKPMLKTLFKEKLDPSGYGGAPLLGLNEIAIVCHGSANAFAIKNAIRIAHKFVEESLVTKIAAAISSLDVKMPGVYESGLWAGRVGQRLDKKNNEQNGFAKNGESQTVIDENKTDANGGNVK